MALDPRLLFHAKILPIRALCNDAVRTASAKRLCASELSLPLAGITPGLYAVRLGGDTMSAATFRA
jgi:hypothetical protein